MRVLKNLLGDGSKMHGDSIYLESGSNDDGNWVKLPDGTIVSRHTSSVGTNKFIWNFPIEFTQGLEVFALPINNIGFSQLGGSKTTKSVTIQSASNTFFNLIAIGK